MTCEEANDIIRDEPLDFDKLPPERQTEVKAAMDHIESCEHCVASTKAVLNKFGWALQELDKEDRARRIVASLPRYEQKKN